MSADIVAIPNNSDRDVVIALREQVRGKLAEIGLLMDEVNRKGYRLEFGMGHDMYGRNTIMRLAIIKEIT